MSWIIAFVGFALLVVLHELGHFAAAKAVGMRVEKFSLFFGPMLAKVTRGETTYGIGPIPLGGYVKISGMNPAEEIPPEHAHRAYYRQPVWKRIVVILAGPVVNIVLAFLILFAVFVSTERRGDTLPDVAATGPPASAVLQKGDRIVAVDGKRGAPADLAKQISSHTCPGEPVQGCRAATPARLTIERDGRTRTVSVTPVYDAKRKRTLAGISFDSERLPPPGPVGAAGESVGLMWDVTTATVGVLARIFQAEQRKQISGVVGSYEVTRQSVAISITRTLLVLALISLSLGIINLFPFLPLDGGHIFWALAEKVRGRPVSFRVMERASAVGIGLVLILFFIGLNNDVSRLLNGGFDLQ